MNFKICLVFCRCDTHTMLPMLPSLLLCQNVALSKYHKYCQHTHEQTSAQDIKIKQRIARYCWGRGSCKLFGKLETWKLTAVPLCHGTIKFGVDVKKVSENCLQQRHYKLSIDAARTVALIELCARACAAAFAYKPTKQPSGDGNALPFPFACSIAGFYLQFQRIFRRCENGKKYKYSKVKNLTFCRISHANC